METKREIFLHTSPQAVVEFLEGMIRTVSESDEIEDPKDKEMTIAFLKDAKTMCKIVVEATDLLDMRELAKHMPLSPITRKS